MLLRGISKIVAIVFVANQVLTATFVLVAQHIDARLPRQTIELFSCVSCALVALWLQSDARRAYLAAREKGYVTAPSVGGQTLQVGADCPKRWLVLLHIELNPSVTGAQ